MAPGNPGTDAARERAVSVGRVSGLRLADGRPVTDAAEKNRDEENVSAESHQAASEARLSIAHEDEGGPRRPEAPKGEGTQADRSHGAVEVAVGSRAAVFSDAGAYRRAGRCDAGRVVKPGSGRLRREDRVRKSIDYRRISRAAVRYGSPEFVVLVAPARPIRDAAAACVDAPPVRRLGLTVSRKVGNAVARNHVKRCVREWFRATRAALPVNVDVVVIAKPGAAELGSGEIRESLDRALASSPRSPGRGGRSRRA